jgi:hypothetical protein
VAPVNVKGRTYRPVFGDRKSGIPAEVLMPVGFGLSIVHRSAKLVG